MTLEDAADSDVWRGQIGVAFAALRTSEQGLLTADAGKRLAVYGPNELQNARRHRWLRPFLARFRNPLILVLLFAAAVSAVVKDPTSFLIIATVVMLSVLIDFVQERRAEDAAARLRERVALRATVLRDGRRRPLPARQLVPGDVLFLSAGDLVPADCRLIESKDLFVNEALLTGESFPAEKHARAKGGTGASVRAGAENAVYMGTSVLSGIARALVMQTGRATRIGAIAGIMHNEPQPTAFTLGIRDFGMMIVRITMLLVLFVLLVNLLFHRPLLESFLFALALAVGLTPELLPMIVSVTLAHGAIRMSREQVIVKRLSAIHDLGSMDILCSDKTGTLTEARIRLIREVDFAGVASKSVLMWARVNAAFETGLKSPLDEAILEAEGVDIGAWRKVDEVPFDFERRRVSVLAERFGQRYLVVKGAPEDILKQCSYFVRGDAPGIVPLDVAAREQADATFEKLGADGFRVLGVAWREVEAEREHAGLEDESELTFAGFAAFLDPPKESARVALASLTRLGVLLKIVTGDNERVTRHVCQELGVDAGEILTGPELDALADEALAVRLQSSNVFCRVTPTQKARIVRGLRRRGHVVGYLGDGINDAPSLQSADVGLSVEGAADVAKEAAAIILLKNDLNVLAQGVREGRRTHVNILKYVMMATSSNFGNMLSMALGVLFLPFLPMLPVQILLNNLLYDSSEITIPMDHVDEELIERPRPWDMRSVREFMLVIGSVSSLFDFLTFGLLLWVFQAGDVLFRTGWFVESLATQVLVIFIIRSRGSPFRSLPHPLLAATSFAVVAVAVILPYTWIGEWFGFVPLAIAPLLSLAAITAAYLIAVQYAKSWFYARHAIKA